VNLDTVWHKDLNLGDTDSLLPPAVITREILQDLAAALAEFTAIVETLEQTNAWRA
jgi:type I restriction enzyme M protein